MSITGISPALSLMMVNNLNAAQARVEDAAAHLSANTRVLTAADDPSAIGRIQTLTSQINENNILIGLNSLDQTGVAGFSSDLSLVQNALASNDPAQVAVAINSLTSTVGGLPAWDGDPTTAQTTTIHHVATSGAYTGAAIGAVTLAPDNGNGAGKSTLNLTLDGQAVALTLNSGSYTADTAAAAIQSALTAGGYNAAATSDGTKVTITSGSTGVSSSVTASGVAAGTLGLTAGTATAGAAAYDQTLTGQNGPQRVALSAGRSVSLPNLQQYADQITAALAGGDRNSALAAMQAVQGVVSDAQSMLGGTTDLLKIDASARGAMSQTLTGELDNLTALDVPATEAQMAKDQLLVQTNAWLLQQMAKNSQDTVKTLLGITG